MYLITAIAVIGMALLVGLLHSFLLLFAKGIGLPEALWKLLDYLVQ